MRITRPIPFDGTDAERAVNRRTHHYVATDWDEDGPCDRRCADCDCKPWHAAADYPCGQEPPRETIDTTPNSVECGSCGSTTTHEADCSDEVTDGRRDRQDFARNRDYTDLRGW